MAARRPRGKGCYSALAYFGLEALDAAEKESMRDLAIRGGAYSPAKRDALLDYCQTDVDALARLLPAMAPTLDLPELCCVAAIWPPWPGWSGRDPLDVDALTQIRRNFNRIKSRLVRAINREYGVYIRADRPPLDPASRFGAAILENARSEGIDPDELAEAADYVCRVQREANADRLAAIRAARSATGLTSARINKLIDQGKDYIDIARFDVQARELAGMYPSLGIGRGYDPENPDEDYAPKLWEVLSEPDPIALPRHHSDTIRRAAELIDPKVKYEAPDYPMRFSAAKWEGYLIRKGIPWPRLENGKLVARR